jgi:hypothetical protein
MGNLIFGNHLQLHDKPPLESMILHQRLYLLKRSID